MKIQPLSMLQPFDADETFADRYETTPQQAVDVVLPVQQLNELWEHNLRSFYREIPIKRLLVGNRGLLDQQLQHIQSFPRVEVFDVTSYKTSGYAVKSLIEQVTTPWFVYLQPSVHLPPGWFDKMNRHTSDYAWIASHSQLTVLARYPAPDNGAYLSAQVVRKVAFDRIVPQIQDDYIDQIEDDVLKRMLEHAGFICQRVSDVEHMHQIVYPAHPNDEREITVNIKSTDDIKTLNMHYSQVMSTIKYLAPIPEDIRRVRASTTTLLENDMLDWKDFQRWVLQTNPLWWRHLKTVEPRFRAAQKARTARKGPRPPANWRERITRRVRPRYIAGGFFLMGLAAGSVATRRRNQSFQQRLQNFLQASRELVWE